VKAGRDDPGNEAAHAHVFAYMLRSYAGETPPCDAATAVLLAGVVREVGRATPQRMAGMAEEQADEAFLQWVRDEHARWAARAVTPGTTAAGRGGAGRPEPSRSFGPERRVRAYEYLLRVYAGETPECDTGTAAFLAGLARGMGRDLRQRVDGMTKEQADEAFLQWVRDQHAQCGSRAVTEDSSQKAMSSPGTGNASPRPSSSSLDGLLAELSGLTGLAPVKAEVRQLVDMAQVEQMRRAAGLPISLVSRHLVFLGNPGTGKTTVARLLAGLYAAIGVLRTGQLIEVTRSDLVAGYVGQTAIKTTDAVKRALGGILFIDEAYSLFRPARSGQDFGQESIDTLVKLMEDHRDELIVIVAGYGDEMNEFIKSNPGLPSRFPCTIQFPDYSTDELTSIFESMCVHDRYEISAEAVRSLRRRLEVLPHDRGFGNGRLVRNIFETAIARQASRIIATRSSDLTQLIAADLGFVAGREENYGADREAADKVPESLA